MVVEELKQRLIAKKTTIKRCEQKISQFRQNRLSEVNKKQVYKELMVSYQERERESNYEF